MHGSMIYRNFAGWAFPSSENVSGWGFQTTSLLSLTNTLTAGQNTSNLLLLTYTTQN
jgi:hypothetical protein